MGGNPQSGVHHGRSKVIPPNNITTGSSPRYLFGLVLYSYSKCHAIDALLRAKDQKDKEKDEPHIHGHMTLEEFIDSAQDPEKCQNFLDLPNLQPDVPPFIR